QLHYALAQPFRVADEIAGDREFAVPIAVRDTRIMVWQLKKARVPTKFVEVCCATSIASGARGHQRGQNENGSGAATGFRRKKICARNIVRWESSLDRTAPCDRRVTVSQSFSKIVVVGRGIILLGI